MFGSAAVRAKRERERRERDLDNDFLGKYNLKLKKLKFYS